MNVGDIFASEGSTYQFVKAVDGSGAFAYWRNPNKYEVEMGELDVSRAHTDLAGVAVVGAINVIPYPKLPWWSNLLFGKVKRWYLDREYPVCGPRYIFIQHKVTVVMTTKEAENAAPLAEIRSHWAENSH